MWKNFLLLIPLLTVLMLAGAQSKEYSLKDQLLAFDKTVTQDPEKARSILFEIEKNNPQNQSDSFRIIILNSWGTYYRQANKFDSAKLYFEQCYKLALSSGNHSKAAIACHNKAEILSAEKKIDSAIEYENLTIRYAKQSGSSQLENTAYISIAQKLRFKGNYRKSNQILFDRINLISENEPETKGVALTTIAMNYDDLDLLDLTEEYYLEANKYLKLSQNNRLISNNIANLVDLYNGKQEYKKALIYADSILYFCDSDNSKIFYHLRKANTFKYLKMSDSALIHINSALELDKKLNDEYGYTLDLILKGQIYRDKGDFEKAYTVLNEAKTLFHKNEIDYLLMEKQLYRDYIYSFLKVKAPTLATDFNYFQEINDSLINQSVDKNLSELEAKYNSSQKEIRITQQQLEIKKQKEHRNFLLSGGGVFLFLLSSGFVWYRSTQKRKELESQNTLMSLQQSISQLEINQLNQQLDPHEIKNLLAGISPEIQQKAPESYKKMIKLLNITKASLNNLSLTENVSLQVEQARNYLDLQKNVMMKNFDYRINDTVHQNGNAVLPRLLLKNLVENAVKHGLKETDRLVMIQLDIHTEAGNLYVTVSDNGCGFTSDALSSNGIGISTYQKMFETLNTKNKQKAEIAIKDNQPGTCVSVKIPIAYNYE